jgi:hypothetical protein
MGMFDSGSGGLFGGDINGNLYGDLLSPQQRQAIAFRGLMSAAGALGQAAMPSRMPIPLGAALGQAAAAMGEGQDAATNNALKAMLTGYQGQKIKSQLAIQDAFIKGNDQVGDILKGMLGGGGAQPQNPAATAGIPDMTPAAST